MKSIRITKQLISNFSVYNRANIYSNDYANKSLLAENGEVKRFSPLSIQIQFLLVLSIKCKQSDHPNFGWKRPQHLRLKSPYWHLQKVIVFKWNLYSKYDTRPIQAYSQVHNFRGYFGNNSRKNNELENDKEREDEESIERADRDDSDDEDNEDKDDSDSDNDNDDEGDLLMPVIEWIGGLIPKLAEMK